MARKNNGNNMNGLLEIGKEGFATLEWEERYGGGSRTTTTTVVTTLPTPTPVAMAVQPPPTAYWWNNNRRLPAHPKLVSPHDITSTTTTTYYNHFVPTPAKEMAISTIDCDQAAKKYNGVLIKESTTANYKRKPTSFFSSLRRGYY
ncbi:OLC1v1020571C1 [Oldenlandia corymbosa var. corymbosa]|uniref:OLC1v1020571C1 n=1 Tax=Oldenlandia corymbosa var. corymbosa TaxID=529605 RepID=A0AAV1EH78_OLDCO|nr:OLC1v1020571C1 [Oldenlandia corymbosa var. corymbosa]